MCEQMTMFQMPDMKRSEKNEKRRWENAFQKWSNKNGADGLMSFGCCGYGSMCEWCKANDYGRPCVRALNAMCREKGILLNYKEMNFEEVWEMKI